MNRWRGPTPWPQRVSSAGATLSVIVGASTLAGWWLGVPQLVQPLPWLPGMAPSTAARAILLGTSILLARRSLISNTRRGAASLCAAIVLLTAAATLIEYVWNRQPWRFTDGSAPS